MKSHVSLTTTIERHVNGMDAEIELLVEGWYAPEIHSTFFEPGEPEEIEIERCVDDRGEDYSELLTDKEQESILGQIRDRACEGYLDEP